MRAPAGAPAEPGSEWVRQGNSTSVIAAWIHANRKKVRPFRRLLSRSLRPESSVLERAASTPNLGRFSQIEFANRAAADAPARPSERALRWPRRDAKPLLTILPPAR